MSDLESKLNQLLSDPDTMAQVMQLAQSLENGGSTQQAQSEPAEAPTASAELSSLLTSLTGGLDPKLIGRLLPVVQQMNRPESSETTAFLYALRPFLRPERRAKVERAAQLARLVHLAKVFISREGFHV